MSGGVMGDGPEARTQAVTIAAYLINLDRSPDRLAAMVPQLDTLGLPWRRIPAVDGKLEGAPWRDYDGHFFARRWGKDHSPGAYGCYMSHVRALTEFVSDEAEFGLIVEDDAVFGADLGAAVNEAITHADLWDVVKLGGIHRGMPATVKRLAKDRRLVAFLQRQTGSIGYLVNRRAAQSYLSRLLPMRVPYDHEFDKAWRYDIRLRGIMPLPISAARIPSTIGNGGDDVPATRLRRLFYKSGVELARIGHYLFRDRDWQRRRATPVAAERRRLVEARNEDSAG